MKDTVNIPSLDNLLVFQVILITFNNSQIVYIFIQKFKNIDTFYIFKFEFH
jgi:hypothetical protein